MLDNKKELVQYRLSTAEEKIASAKLLLDNGSYKDSIGRSYYAIFASTRALLAEKGVDFSKHAGVISYFQKEYVKTGIIEVKYSKYFSQAFQFRNNADYADFYLVSKNDAQEQYEHAEEFVLMIKKYFSSYYESNSI